MKLNSFLRVVRLTELTLFTVLLFVPAFAQKRDQVLHNPTSGDPVSKLLLLRVIRAEDERRWDNTLLTLLGDKDPAIRSRAALAVGRIGNERAIPALMALLGDKDQGVRAMAAFTSSALKRASLVSPRS